VALIIWFPFLSFESGREFSDLRSLLLLQNINPTNYQQAWCDPRLSLVTLGGVSGDSQAGLDTASPAKYSLSLAQRVERRFVAILDGLQASFSESVQMPGAALVMLLAALGGLVVGWLRGRDQARVFVICLTVPWAVLVLIAEPGKTERFLWLWPLQVVAVAAFATYALVHPRLPRPFLWAVPLVVAVVMLADPLRAHLNSWLRTGWAGTDAEEVQVVDYAGAYLRAQGKDHAAIGYETFVYPFMARYHAVDPHYKVGAEFDLLFKYRYAIVNVNQCGEGVSSTDDVRIVQQRPQDVIGAPDQYFPVQRDPGFRSLGHVGSYEIFTRI
jgi:hypothetical protein